MLLKHIFIISGLTLLLEKKEFEGTISIFTVRNCSCGKVMFLHLSVSHSVHEMGCVVYTLQADTPLPWADPTRQTPPPRDGHCSGRYASYRNALLFYEKSLSVKNCDCESCSQMLLTTQFTLFTLLTSIFPFGMILLFLFYKP